MTSKIEKNQIKRIHMLKSGLRMTDMEYRVFLFGNFQVESCKELNFLQAEELILKMLDLRKRSYPALSPRQYDYIKRLWNLVTRQKTHKDKRIALRRFCKKITGIEDPYFLDKTNAAKLINALKQMLFTKNNTSAIAE